MIPSAKLFISITLKLNSLSEIEPVYFLECFTVVILLFEKSNPFPTSLIIELPLTTESPETVTSYVPFISTVLTVIFKLSILPLPTFCKFDWK